MPKSFFGALGAGLLLALGLAAWHYTFQADPEPVACTMEAKQCPDGSYVGRTGPSCEFAPCPGTPVSEAPADETDALWRTATDTVRQIQYVYPDHLTTEFIDTQEWPPSVTLTASSTPVCKETGSEITANGKTEKRLVDSHQYCRTMLSEGAAGSTFTNYIYTTTKDDKTVTVEFTLRFVQCGNYDEPNKTNCEKEREAFDPDSLADKIAQSVGPLAPTTQRVSLNGTYECLPHAPSNTSGTKECTIGLKADDGKHYALDFNLFEPGPSVVGTFHTGDRVTVEGPLTPIEMLSSDHWRLYDVTGIVSVTGMQKI